MRRRLVIGLIVVVALALPALAAISYYRQASAPPAAGQPLAAAVEHLEQAIALEPQNVEGYRYLSAAYRLQNRLDAAEEVWQRAARANPGQTWPLVELGDMYAEAGLPLKARAAYFRAADLNPQDATANQRLEQSAAAVAGWQAMQAALDATPGAANAAAVLVNQPLANGWTFVGYVADAAALSEGQAGDLRTFWRAPTAESKPSLQPELWQPVAPAIWMSTTPATSLLPGLDAAGSSGNTLAAFPARDIYNAAPGTRQVRRTERNGSLAPVAALVNDPASRSSSFVGEWLALEPDTAYVAAAAVYSEEANPRIAWQWDGDIAAQYGPREQYAQDVGQEAGWRLLAGLAAPPPGAERMRMFLLNEASTGTALFAEPLLLSVPLPVPLHPLGSTAAEQRLAAWRVLAAQLLYYPGSVQEGGWQAAAAALGPLVSVEETMSSGWTLRGYSTDEDQLVRGVATPLALYWQGPPGVPAGAATEGWIDLGDGAWLQVQPAATNLIPFGDFERGLAEWPGDIYGAPPEARGLVVTERNGYTTTVATLSNTATFTSSSLLSTLQPVGPGTVFVQAGWMKGETGRGYIGYHWQGLLPLDRLHEGYIADGYSPLAWTHYAGLAEPLPGSSEVQVWLLNHLSTGVSYFDNILLVPAPAPGIVVMPAGELTGAFTGTLAGPAAGASLPALTPLPTPVLPADELARLLNLQYWANGALVNDEAWLMQVAEAGPAYLLDQYASDNWTLYGFTADEQALAAGGTGPVFYFWQGPADWLPGEAAAGWYSLGVGYWLHIETATASLLPNGDLEREIVGTPPAFPLDERTGEPAHAALQRTSRSGYVSTALVLAGEGGPGAVVSSPLPVTPGQMVLQVALLRTENGGRGQLGVQWLGGSASGQDTRWVAFNAANGVWQQVAGLLEPRAGTSEMRLLARNSQTAGAVLLDDLLLLPVTLPAEPAATESPTESPTASPAASPAASPTALPTESPAPTVAPDATPVG